MPTDIQNQTVITSENAAEAPVVETNESPAIEGVLVEGNVALDAPIVEEVKLTNNELKAAYAILKEEAKAAHDEAKAADPSIGKFVFQTFAEYKNQYNIKWELAHPNPKDALPSTDEVLNQVDAALGVVGAAIVTTTAAAGASKMSLCKAIFAAELAEKGAAGLVRKTILARFVAEAGCTPAGANTYYNTCRDKAGLVNHK